MDDRKKQAKDLVASSKEAYKQKQELQESRLIKESKEAQEISTTPTGGNKDRPRMPKENLDPSAPPRPNPPTVPTKEKLPPR